MGLPFDGQAHDACGGDRSYAGATDARVLPSSVSITHHQHRRYLMEARVSNNLAPAAAHDGAVRCLFAIELSKKSWVVAVNTPLSDKISIYKLKPCDWKELLQLINRIRKRVSEELKKPVEVISCYEAGYDGFWLHRLLEAQGVRNHVIDPASLQVLPLPRWLTGCTCPFLPLSHRPSPSPTGSAIPPVSVQRLQ